VRSAGLAALVGEPVAAPMARLLRSRGIDPAGFGARQLDPAALGSAAVVLTMTAAQRSAVVTRAPAAVRRTFTLREFAAFARLADGGPTAEPPAQRLDGLVAAAPRARSRRAVVPGEDDIADPYGRADEAFARAFDRIGGAVADLLAVLTPRSASTLRDGTRDPAAAELLLSGETGRQLLTQRSHS
jgi:protein-tyrosine phosphatase